MLNILNKLLNSQEALKVQNCQYQEFLLLEDTVPAGSQKLGSVNVSSLGHFCCQYIVGHYTTLDLYGEPLVVVDLGISYLRGKLIDGSASRPLFNDYIPLDLILTPGRTKSRASQSIMQDPPSSNLFYPIRFEYIFPVNSQIQFDVKNDSLADNSYSICFYGYRFPMSHQIAAQQQKTRR